MERAGVHPALVWFALNLPFFFILRNEPTAKERKSNRKGTVLPAAQAHTASLWKHSAPSPTQQTQASEQGWSKAHHHLMPSNTVTIDLLSRLDFPLIRLLPWIGFCSFLTSVEGGFLEVF